MRREFILTWVKCAHIPKGIAAYPAYPPMVEYGKCQWSPNISNR